ncbi:cobalamin biosynthesis protein [Chloroflexota bacterium]
MPQRIIILCIALVLDLLFGDPPNAYHPTAWMGSLIVFFTNHAPKTNKPGIQFFYGTIIVLLGAVIVGVIGWGLVLLIQNLPYPINLLLAGLLVKSTFTVRGLVNISNEITNALQTNDLEDARRLTSWHLVSRDTTSLNTSQVSAAAIESVAENTSDSIVAPIFYYLVFGLPGALIYRFINTSDALLGYRDERREWLGKVSARADDFLNLVPARLTVLLLFFAAPFSGCDLKKAVSIWRTDRYKTDSPNAGHPMSAAAGGLGIKLEKVDRYVLGEDGRDPQPGDLEKMVRLMQWSVGIGILLVVVCGIGFGGI